MAQATKAEDRDDAFYLCWVVRDARGERIGAYRRSGVAILLEQGEQTKCPDAAAGVLEEGGQWQAVVVVAPLLPTCLR